MTVGDLKTILESVPDDYAVKTGTYITQGVKILPDTRRVDIS